jgi:hypothetical protein
MSDFNKTTTQKCGPPAATVINDFKRKHGLGAAAEPVFAFYDDPSFIVLTETKFSFRCIPAITLTQKRVRPPVRIILVVHAELASVRALLVKGLDHSNLPSTLKLVCDVPYLLHAHTQTKFRKCK